MAGIFISYRWTDGGWTGRIKDHLQLRFGNSLVWQDVDDIKGGQNFPAEITKAIKTSNAALIVIGPNWGDKVGLLRLKNKNDFVRREIVQALKSKATVIPVLVGNASMPDKKVLPLSINRIVLLQKMTINDADWGRGIELLIEQLQQIVRASGKTEELPVLHNKIEQMENAYFQLIQQNSAKALDIARQALKLLDEQMPRYPQDSYLQIQRGYFLKNESMALQDLNDKAGAMESLSKAEQVFTTIRDESKVYLASAYNGIGSVKVLRQNYKEALQWINQALKLVPDYPAALHDRNEIMRYIKSKN